MAAEIRTTRLNASGLVHDGRARVYGISWVGGAGAGTITIKDGIDASAPTKLVLDTPLGTTLSGGGGIPEKGVLCARGIYCVLAGPAFVTLFYEG